MRRLLSAVYLLTLLGLYLYLLIVEFQVTRQGKLGGWGVFILCATALGGVVLLRLGSDAVTDWGRGDRWSSKTRFSLITGAICLGFVAAMLGWLKQL